MNEQIKKRGRSAIVEYRKALSAAEPLIRAQVFQEIRDAAGRDDVVEAGLRENVIEAALLAYEGENALANEALRDSLQRSMEFMLDQIERTQSDVS